MRRSTGPGSQSTDASAIGVDSHLEMASDRKPVYMLGLSDQHLRAELMVCCELLVRGLDLLSRICKLNLDVVLRDLEIEYKTILDRDEAGENDSPATAPSA